MNSIKRNPCEEFNERMWLYIEKSLDENEMVFWNDHLANCENCTDLLNESLEIITSYNSIPLEDLTDAHYERMITNASGNIAMNNDSAKSVKFQNRRSLLEIFGFYRLTFGGAVVLAAIIFLLITFINDPKLPEIENKIPGHLLSWNNERVSEKISNIEDQIISFKIDDWDIYLVKNNNKEKWDNAVRSIQKQIRKMKKQADSPAM